MAMCTIQKANEPVLRDEYVPAPNDGGPEVAQEVLPEGGAVHRQVARDELEEGPCLLRRWPEGAAAGLAEGGEGGAAGGRVAVEEAQAEAGAEKKSKNFTIQSSRISKSC